MPVEDVFTITGRGTVATGRVERGDDQGLDEVEIVGFEMKPENRLHRRRNVPQNIGSSRSRRQHRSAASGC